MATFDDVVQANRRDSLLLLFLLLILLGAMGAAGAELLLGDMFFEGALFALLCGAIYFFFIWFCGDSFVLFSLGAEEAERDEYPTLYNVTEELCIASGLPMPKIYVLDEKSINACATGRDPEHSSVAVTKGLLEKLSREETMAVVAHEMSHVKNLDIRFSTLLAVTVGAILLIRDIILNSMFRLPGSRRRDSNSGGDSKVMIVLFVICVIFIIISPLITLLLQSMASRSREYMADADGVKLTRNPDAMISTLKKISDESGSIIDSSTSGTAHIFFASPNKQRFFDKDSIFSTHPSLEDRIRSIRQIYGVSATADQGHQPSKTV